MRRATVGRKSVAGIVSICHRAFLKRALLHRTGQSAGCTGKSKGARSSLHYFHIISHPKTRHSHMAPQCCYFHAVPRTLLRAAYFTISRFIFRLLNYIAINNICPPHLHLLTLIPSAIYISTHRDYLRIVTSLHIFILLTDSANYALHSAGLSFTYCPNNAWEFQPLTPLFSIYLYCIFVFHEKFYYFLE